MPYTVFVDDNFNHADPEKRLTDRTFESLSEARTRCKHLLEEELVSYLEQGFAREKLLITWLMYGEDPFIEGYEFSAVEFVKQWCAGLAAVQ